MVHRYRYHVEKGEIAGAADGVGFVFDSKVSRGGFVVFGSKVRRGGFVVFDSNEGKTRWIRA